MRQVRCDKCGTLYQDGRTDCKNCGAPYKEEPKQERPGVTWLGPGSAIYPAYSGYVPYATAWARGVTWPGYWVTGNDNPERYRQSDGSYSTVPKPPSSDDVEALNRLPMDVKLPDVVHDGESFPVGPDSPWSRPAPDKRESPGFLRRIGQKVGDLLGLTDWPEKGW